jgi:hypothetical protein
LTALLAAVAGAQIKLDPGNNKDADAAIAAFERIANETDSNPVACRVAPLPARMSFSLRFWSGFQASWPVAEYKEREVRAAVVLRVSPQTPGARPTYFYDSLLVNERLRQSRPVVGFSGGFYLGPGTYDVLWMLVDGGNRTCRSKWTVRAKGGASSTALRPGVLEAVGLESWRGRLPESESKGPRATVFLHAAPVWRGRNFTKLSSYDRMFLLSSLTSMLDLTGFSSVRLVAYDASRKRVLMDVDKFNQDAYSRLARVLREENFGVIDYKVIRENQSDAAFLTGLIQKDRGRDNPSEVLVFLGPELRASKRLPPETIEFASTLPPSYYLALSLMPVKQGDAVDKLVKAAKGKTYLVMRAQDLLNPIRAMKQLRP